MLCTIHLNLEESISQLERDIRARHFETSLRRANALLRQLRSTAHRIHSIVEAMKEGTLKAPIQPIERELSTFLKTILRIEQWLAAPSGLMHALKLRDTLKALHVLAQIRESTFLIEETIQKMLAKKKIRGPALDSMLRKAFLLLKANERRLLKAL